MKEMIRLLFVIIVLITSSCSGYPIKSTVEKKKSYNDSIESELLELKNQAFCMCYYKSLKNENATINPPDGSNYIQVSDIVLKYIKDKRFNNIIEKWSKKKYKSYNEENKLYLMKCLDFYNSDDLKDYIDSVRIIETR